MKYAARVIFGATFLTFVSALTACDQVKKVDNMNKNTEEMNVTTKGLYEKTANGMDKTTSQMDQMIKKSEILQGKMEDQLNLSKDLHNTLKEAFDQGREHSASDERDKNMKRLVEARGMNEKIEAAAKYVVSFEYQLWVGDIGYDKNQDRRDMLFDEAINDFLTELGKFRIFSTPVDPFAARNIERNDYAASNLLSQIFNKNIRSAVGSKNQSEDNMDACFSALAAVLHLNNHIQLERVKELKGVQVESMLSLLTQGLMAYSEVSDGKVSLENLPLWKKRVLEERKLAIELLQARLNVLPMIALHKVLPADDQGVIAPLKLLMTSKNVHAFSFNFDMEKLSTLELAKVEEFLKLALETREIIKTKLKLIPEMNSGVRNFLRNLKIKATEKVSPQTAAIQTSIIGLINELKQ